MLEASDRSIIDAARDLAAFGVEASFLVPTKTGLRKSILDAIAPLRAYLVRERVHDYSSQSQGTDSKRVVDAFLVGVDHLVPSKASLYRPLTKDGDPRIWFSGLGDYAIPGNVLSILALDGALYVINASSPEVWNSRQAEGSVLHALLLRKAGSQRSAAEDLLFKLRSISSKGFIPTVRAGPTGVGATLEYELGIETNASKKPDYRGIEIKATRRYSRRRAASRVNLFSQVPDWEASERSGGGALLSGYGYTRNGRRQLYCTLNDLPNPQGLYLSVDSSRDALESLCVRDGKKESVCVWPMGVLRDRLVEKHQETFWVKAECRGRGREESFHYVEVEHTRHPFVSNLEHLLAAGKITFDFTLSAKPTGGTRDHGYLFKIWPEDLDLLFPPRELHSLV